MSSRDNQALHRLVERLAREQPADIQAVLARLPAPQRQAVEDLLEDRPQSPAPEPAKPKDNLVAGLPGLSSWLEERLAASARADGARPSEHAAHGLLAPPITDRALAALQAAAQSLARDGDRALPLSEDHWIVKARARNADQRGLA